MLDRNTLCAATSALTTRKPANNCGGRIQYLAIRQSHSSLRPCAAQRLHGLVSGGKQVAAEARGTRLCMIPNSISYTSAPETHRLGMTKCAARATIFTLLPSAL